MKKSIFILALACLWTAGANAFDFYVKSTKITESNADLFGDGKVAVTFRPSAKEIILSLNGAVIQDNLPKAAVVVFWGDNEYNTLRIDVAGVCSLVNKTEDAATALIAGTGRVIVQQSQPDSKISFIGACFLNNAEVVFGSEKTDLGLLDVYVKTEYNMPAMIVDGINSSVLLRQAKIVLEANDKLIVGTFDRFFPGAAFTPDVTFKSGALYQGETQFTGKTLTIEPPFPLTIGGVYINKNNCTAFNPGSTILKDGSVSYDPEKNILTLEGVTINGGIKAETDNLTISLKGDNFITADGTSGDVICVNGSNLIITGEAHATLTLKGNGTVGEGIRAEGNITVNGFAKLEINSVGTGIDGGMDGNASLTVGYTNIDIQSDYKALDGFWQVFMPERMLITPAEAEFSDVEHSYVIMDEMFIGTPVTNLQMSFANYNINFCDVEITGQNCDNIVVPGTTGKAAYDNKTRTLTLNNFDGSALTDNPYAIEVPDKFELTIALVGTSTLVSNDRVIDIIGTKLVISGNGTLNINSTNDGITFHNKNARLEVKKGARLNINAESYGIHCDPAEREINCMEGLDDYAPVVAVDNAQITIAPTSMAAVSDILDLELGTDMQIMEPAGASFRFNCTNMVFGITTDGYAATTEKVTIAPKNGIISGMENIAAPASQAVKTVENGRVVILRDGIRYTLLGTEIE